MARGPWNDWYHCDGHTYGTWLRGDKRGWRSRHHREHVEGDYRNPPPPECDRFMREYSKQALKHPPVKLNRDQAVLAGAAFVRRLIQNEIELLSFVLDPVHFHLVGRFSNHNPRKWIGLGKQYSAHLLVKRFEELEAPIWGRRCQCVPITSRTHQVAAVQYDLDHVNQGALFVWSFRDSVPELLMIRSERERDK